MPRHGAFAVSEVLPLISARARNLEHLQAEAYQLRIAADEAKAEAKRVRASFISRLRVWGIQVDGYDIPPIKTSAERQEWANADPDVQQAELDADLAQSAKMNAQAAYELAKAEFDTLNGMLAIERDELKRAYEGRGQG